MIMRELHTEHDNLVSTFTAYMPRSRAEALVPAQLHPFFQAHLSEDFPLDNKQRSVLKVLCQCFTFDIDELAYGPNDFTVADELQDRELPRLGR